MGRTASSVCKPQKRWADGGGDSAEEHPIGNEARLVGRPGNGNRSDTIPGAGPKLLPSEQQLKLLRTVE
jgi:hypothetical protein